MPTEHFIRATLVHGEHAPEVAFCEGHAAAFGDIDRDLPFDGTEIADDVGALRARHALEPESADARILHAAGLLRAAAGQAGDPRRYTLQRAVAMALAALADTPRDAETSIKAEAAE